MDLVETIDLDERKDGMEEGRRIWMKGVERGQVTCATSLLPTRMGRVAVLYSRLAKESNQLQLSEKVSTLTHVEMECVKHHNISYYVAHDVNMKLEYETTDQSSYQTHETYHILQ